MGTQIGYGSQQPIAPQGGPQEMRAAYLAAVKSGEEQDIRRLLLLLPQEEGRYVFQGDLLYTEQQMFEVIRDRHAESKSGIRPQLIVRQRTDGKPDYWETSASRRLTYSINQDSFGASAGNVIQLMALASAEWVRVCPECGVTFNYNQIPENEPGKVTFIVRRKNSAVAIASAFFPSWAPRDRYLNLGDRALTSVDTQGIIRHELGHVLGYEHENYQDPSKAPIVPGCALEKSRWVPLTPYDPQSVMHTFCGVDDATRFNITEIDKTGHRKLYGSPTP